MSDSATGQFATGFSTHDIEHGLEFEIQGPGPIIPGTEIVVTLADDGRGRLQIVTEKEAGIWQAQWHDETGLGSHDGALVRLLLVPPVEFEDEQPSLRKFLVELIGDHELEGPEAQSAGSRP